MRLLLPEQRPLDRDDLYDLYDSESPCLRAGFVISTDGGVALDGGSRALQTPSDQAVFAALRTVADAVVVGAGTARGEGYGPVRHRPSGTAWRAAHDRRPAPLVLVSRSLDLDPGGPLLAGDVRPVVVTCAAARPPEALLAVADVLVCGDDRVDLAQAVTALHDRGLRRLLCEGGPSLLTALLQAALVDELCLTHVALLLGPAPTLLTRALPQPAGLVLRSLVDGEDGALLARYAVRPAPEHGGSTGTGRPAGDPPTR